LSIPDGEITVKLKADLKARGLENVQVETVNGVVSLTGYVEDDLQKRLAEQTAMASPGVSNVRVNIEVQKRPPVNGNTKLGPRRGGI
jgi:osmotically-inducible protein OsmY